MRDLALEASGALAIIVAVVHGAIAELHVFRRARIESRRTRTLLRMVWQCSTLDWICFGVLLIATPGLGSESARRWVIAAAVVAFAYGAVANLVVTRGLHIGGYLMGFAVALALMGL
jgi:hypothetical protein